MVEKLKIDTNGAAPGIYGPFYTMCDIIVGENGAVIVQLSEDARVEGHVYRLQQETKDGPDGPMTFMAMRLTKPDESNAG